MDTYETVNAAVTAIRMRIWGQPKAKGCEYRSRAEGAVYTYTFKVGNVIWNAYFDNYGRADTYRAETQETRR